MVSKLLQIILNTLPVFGAAFIVAAGYMWIPEVGYALAGVSCFVLEWYFKQE